MTPGSGKSTWIQNHRRFFCSDAEIISRDAIRFSLLKEGEPYFSREKEVWTTFMDRAAAAIKTKEDTIIDATHLNEGSRGKVFRALRNNLTNVSVIAIVINPGLEKAILQNNMRKGRSYVPEDAIRNMNSSFTMPTFEEGFDEIYIIEEGPIKIIQKEV